VAVTPATLPTSTGIGVVVDLSSIGGLMSQTFVDNGTLGDVTAGDLVFSFQATVAANTTPGLKSLPATLSDAQGRFGAAIINLTVEPATPAVRASWGKVKASYR
jgi:hypothetical protein